MSPTEDTNALIDISCLLKNDFAIAPAATLAAVSRAELRPPPL